MTDNQPSPAGFSDRALAIAEMTVDAIISSHSTPAPALSSGERAYVQLGIHAGINGALLALVEAGAIEGVEPHELKDILGGLE